MEKLSWAPLIITQNIWSIQRKAVEPKGWNFYINFCPTSREGVLLRPLNLDVGFFRDLKKGEESCQRLIDFCIEIQRDEIVEIVARYSRNRHDSSRAIREILKSREAKITAIEEYFGGCSQ